MWLTKKEKIAGVILRKVPRRYLWWFTFTATLEAIPYMVKLLIRLARAGGTDIKKWLAEMKKIDEEK